LKRFFIALCLLLAACNGEEDPPPSPTLINVEEALATAGLPGTEQFHQTQTANAPTATRIVTWTFTPSITLSPTSTFIPTFTPSMTNTFSAIQETEQFLYQRGTSIAQTATAQVPPTPTHTSTPTPTITDTREPSLTPTPDLPNVPEANQIIFTSNRAGSQDIWVMELDGSNPRLLEIAPESDETTASCHPDGLEFIFTSNRGGDREIYVETYADADPRPLTDTDGENFDPAYSPDGSMIAFISSRSGSEDIWLMDSGGGNARLVVEQPGSERDVQWSPDGGQLYYVSNRAGQYDIYRYNLATETEIQVTDTPDRDEFMPALGYDFETLVFIANLETDLDSTGALWMDMLNDDRSARATITAEGRVDHPAWIAPGRLLISANLGGITHILLVDLTDASRSILTNIGPDNIMPRPCYIADEVASSELPTGLTATPTATVTPVLISEYTAVINPGDGWQQVETTFEIEDLLEIDDPRLQVATVTMQNQRITFEWEDDDRLYTVTVLPEVMDGALIIYVTGYTIDGLPEDLTGMQDIAFKVREKILLESVPAGRYRAESLAFSDDSLMLVFSIPTDE
jgi:Tol biopolymer transport system component